jgi:hypothetical protein
LTYEHNVAIGNEGFGFAAQTPATQLGACLYADVRPGNTITYRNNITHSNRDGALFVEGSPGQWNVVSQHNNWFILASQSEAMEIMGVRYTPAQINAGSFGTGDICTNPLFADENATPPDVHLRTGSACIDAGMDLGNPYQGDAPDMGRYEFGTP